MSIEGAKQQRLQLLNDRKGSKAKQAGRAIDRHKGRDVANEAGPSELPSRDTSSSDSGRTGQNGARAGPNGPQGRSSHPFRPNTTAAVAAESGLDRGVSEQVNRRSDRPEEVKDGLDRQSSKSGDSSGGGLRPKGNCQRAARPSRLGPGRGNARPEVPTERALLKNGRKRPLQVMTCGLRLCQALI